ncbi:hypothetical protein ACFZA9_12170 [Streptomyces olivaceus]|uniref:hypothetical protein n=1 Tax=Streptomyces olivaceus TaxID=47716 RepID=UPI0036E1954A
MATSFQTPPAPPRAADLAPVTEALAMLVAEFAELPRPFIALNTTGAHIVIQLMDPAEFEPWREALALSPAGVELVVTKSSAWLAADGRYRGVVFQLTGHGVLVSVEQASSPRGAEAVAA